MDYASSQRQGDLALLQRVAELDDEDAIEDIMTRYERLVHGVSMTVVRNRADADEISNECFAALVRNASRIRGTIGGWLRRTAMRRSLNVVRRNLARRKREEIYAMNYDMERTTEWWGEMESIITCAVEELPHPYRLMVTDYFFDRKSRKSIAVEFDVSPMTVSRWIKVAVTKVRAGLSEQDVVGIVIGPKGTEKARESRY